jgi:hypothetical protein
MANPLAKLFVQLQAKGDREVSQKLDDVQKEVKATKREADKAEKSVGTFTEKLTKAGKPAEDLVGRVSALRGVFVGVAAAGLALGLAISKTAAAFRDGAGAAAEYLNSIQRTGREDVEARFEKIRARVEEISELIGQNQTSLGTLFAAGRSRESLIEEKRALEEQLKFIEQQRKGLRNRERRAEREAAEAQAADEIKVVEKVEAAKKESNRRVADDAVRVFQEQQEQQARILQDFADRQVEIGRSTIDALAGLQGSNAASANQILRSLERLNSSIQNGGRRG